ncbi:MAG: hypothetical protein M3Q58_03190 [Bacteroidota bacterium]|jgi:hypothetical protein|nr:hypothetical protein [Bacteroidota bacterium]
MKNLQLSLKTNWFEMTKAGIKTEDYREINAYWFKRLIYDYKKVYSYISIRDNHEDLDVLNLCKDSFWKKTFWFKPFEINTMTLGYPKSTDIEKILKLEHKGIEIREGNPEWGAKPGKLYFVIKHGSAIGCI